MKLGICTIQRDRGRWLTEWVAFHYLVGFRQFYFFAHRCTDETSRILHRLRAVVDLTVYEVPEDVPRPQLEAYRFAYATHGNAVDWMAFIDGDEFLFPTRDSNLQDTLAALDDGALGALGAYWSCFGSSGHLVEPEGLIIENFRRRATDDFSANSHVKSIVRGGLHDFQVMHNAHLFRTIGGTFDEKHRFIDRGLTDYRPSYERLRINHYVCQSRQYFTGFKQRSGAADAVGGHDYVRPESWWTAHDRNDVHDSSVERFYAPVRSLIRDWSEATPGSPDAPFPVMPQPVPSPAADPVDLSRNRLCPCGSGKRFKHCHGIFRGSL